MSGTRRKEVKSGATKERGKHINSLRGITRGQKKILKSHLGHRLNRPQIPSLGPEAQRTCKDNPKQRVSGRAGWEQAEMENWAL